MVDGQKSGSPGLSRRPVQERSQQTVRRILAAAVSLLARNGVEGLTTNRVAEEAELSVASLYRFFPNKQAVIYAAYSAWIDELSACVANTAAEWREVLLATPGRWPEAALAIVGVLSESRRAARAEYELLRAMFSHRELRARDGQHTRALAEMVADLMQVAGARADRDALIRLAAFANEQFTLAVELAGARPDEERADFTELACQTYLCLWHNAMERKD